MRDARVATAAAELERKKEMGKAGDEMHYLHVVSPGNEPHGAISGSANSARSGRGALLTCGDVHPNPGPCADPDPPDGEGVLNSLSNLQIDTRGPSLDNEHGAQAPTRSASVAPRADTAPGPGSRWPEPDRALYVGSLNVRGLSEPSKLLSIALEMRRRQLALMVLCETNSTVQSRRPIRIPGDDKHAYVCYEFPHPTRPRGAGLAIMVRAELDRGSNGCNVEDVQPVNSCVVRCTLAAFGKRIHIFGVYLPTGDFDTSKAALEHLAEQLPERYEPTLVIGDFNAHIRLSAAHPSAAPTNRHGRMLLDWADAADLRLASKFSRARRANPRWTWRSDNFGDSRRYSNIDHVFANKQACRMQVRVQMQFPTVKTDHRLCRITIPPRGEARSPMPGLPISKALPPRGNGALDVQYDELRVKLLSVQESTPALTLPPYVSERTLHLVKANDAARDEDRATRNKLLNAIRRSLRRDRKDWLARIAASVTDHLSCGNIHFAFRALQRFYRPRLLQSLASNKVLKRARDYFENLLAPLDGEFVPAPDLPPLLPVAAQAPPSNDQCVAYLDGSYVDGRAGYAVVSNDPRLEARYDALIGGRVGLTPQETNGLIAQLQQHPDLSQPPSGDGSAFSATSSEVESVRGPAEPHDAEQAAVPVLDVTSRSPSVFGDGFVPTSDAQAYEAELCALCALMIVSPDGATVHAVLDNQAVVSVARRLQTLWTTRHIPCIDIWRVILARSLKVHLRAYWTRGHVGTVANELADRGANKARASRQADYVNPLKKLISEHVMPAVRNAIPDDVPTDNEIQRALSKLNTYKAPGPGGVRPATLKSVATSKDAEVAPIRESLFALYKNCYSNRTVPLAFLDGSMSLIPKGGKFSVEPSELRGITVLPSCGRVYSNILNERLMSAQLHPAQHGFVRQLSTLHAVLELKQRVRRARLNLSTLKVVYVDVRKAYDSLDRRALAHALREMGAGEDLIATFEFILKHESKAVNISNRYSTAFQPRRGTRQGDPSSPTLFDFVMDLVIREFGHVRPDSDTPILFADDAALTAVDTAELQADVDALVAALARFGMAVNADKTKLQVFLPVKNRLANRVYAPGQSFKLFKRTRVPCPQCGAQLARGDLRRHLTTRRCQLAAAAEAVARSRHFDDRAADITESDDEPLPAVFGRVVARQRFGVEAVFVNMPFADGNDPTPCPRCRGHPQYFSKRTAMNKHMQMIHGLSAVFDPLRPNASPYVACATCGMAVTSSFMDKHVNSSLCRQVLERNRKRALLKQSFAPVQPIMIGGAPVERVFEFKYLGVWMVSYGGDELSLDRNTRSANASYGAMRDLLRNAQFAQRQRRQVIGVVVSAALLYGCETWDLTNRIIERLRGAQYRYLRPGSGLPCEPQPDGSIRVPSRAAVLSATEATDVANLVRRRRLNFAVKVFADTRCLAYSSVTAAVASGQRFPGLAADWLRQVQYDASLVGVQLGVTLYSHTTRTKIDGFDFSTRPLG